MLFLSKAGYQRERILAHTHISIERKRKEWGTWKLSSGVTMGAGDIPGSQEQS